MSTLTHKPYHFVLSCERYSGYCAALHGHALFIKCYIELEPNTYIPGLRFGSEHGDGEEGVVGVLGDVEAVSEVAIEGQVGHVTVGQVHSSHSSQQLSHGSHSQS